MESCYSSPSIKGQARSWLGFLVSPLYYQFLCPQPMPQSVRALNLMECPEQLFLRSLARDGLACIGFLQPLFINIIDITILGGGPEYPLHSRHISTHPYCVTTCFFHLNHQDPSPWLQNNSSPAPIVSMA